MLFFQTVWNNVLYFCLFVILKYNIKEYISCDELLCHLSDLPIVIISIGAGWLIMNNG